MYKVKMKVPKISFFDRDKFKKATRQEDLIALNSALVAVQGKIILRTPVGDTGLLRASIKTSVSQKPQNILGLVFSGVKYAIPLEWGRRPGKFPPYRALINWVRRSSAGRAVWEALRGKYPKIKLAQVAFVVARAIKNKGIKEKKFFRGGIKDAKPEIRNIFKNLGKKLKMRWVRA